jgi:hypothetical protein
LQTIGSPHGYSLNRCPTWQIGATAGTIAGFAEDVKQKNFGSNFNGLRGDPHAVCEVADWQSLRSGKQPSV